ADPWDTRLSLFADDAGFQYQLVLWRGARILGAVPPNGDLVARLYRVYSVSKESGGYGAGDAGSGGLHDAADQAALAYRLVRLDRGAAANGSREDIAAARRREKKVWMTQ